jgi:hypothetical protein
MNHRKEGHGFRVFSRVNEWDSFRRPLKGANSFHPPQL